jgi:Ca2+-binding EF-hand superfamily protein
MMNKVHEINVSLEEFTKGKKGMIKKEILKDFFRNKHELNSFNELNSLCIEFRKARNISIDFFTFVKFLDKFRQEKDKIKLFNKIEGWWKDTWGLRLY